MQRFEQVRPGWDFFNDFVQGMELYGLYPVFTKYRKARHTVTKDRKWLDENNNGNRCNTVEVKEWAEIGFPITGNEHSSCGALLVADAAEGLTDDEIRTLLSGPVFMDIDALKILHERGFSSLAGAEPGRYIHGTHERFTDHPVNGSHKGYMRTMFWYGGNEVIPTAPETQIVSELIEFDAKTKSADCMTMYENQLGGRVVVMGYEPWSHLGLSWKWQQLQSVVDWATRGMLPLSIDRMVRVLPLVRMNESRTKFGLLLFNNGLDDTGKFRIRLKNKAKKVMALSPHGKRNPVPATWEYGVLTIEIDSIGAWDTLMLIGG